MCSCTSSVFLSCCEVRACLGLRAGPEVLRVLHGRCRRLLGFPFPPKKMSSCCAGPCVLVAAVPWCSGAKTEAQCASLHTRYHPCVWRRNFCTKGNRSECPPPYVPMVTLNTGAHMPMLAFGTGMLPTNSIAKRHERAPLSKTGNVRETRV